jgi:hypothetical protein
MNSFLEAKMRLYVNFNLFYDVAIRYIVNCGLLIAFGTTTHSDRERSRVGIQFYEVKMRLTTFFGDDYKAGRALLVR